MRRLEMRRFEILSFCVLLVFAASACSRLTFVKPNAKRRGFEQVAPTYSVDGSRRKATSIGANERLMLAQQRLAAGDLERAETEAQAVLRADPRSADAHTLLAVIDQRQGRQAAAGAHYARAAELAPGNGAHANNYGAWLCATGRAAESLTWFDRALADARYATPGGALANAGSCALQAGQLARAGRDLRRALEIDPENAVALMAMAESELAAGRAFEARAFIERRLALVPIEARALQLASQIERRLGDTAAAERYRARLRGEFPGAIVPEFGGNGP